MFLKRVILWYGMVCNAMLCYPMLWCGMESMVCYEISMLCYAMVYDVKDKHGATLPKMICLTTLSLIFYHFSKVNCCYFHHNLFNFVEIFKQSFLFIKIQLDIKLCE